MATTVNNAFVEFMKDTVNLDADKTKLARASRDNLIENIKGFSDDADFFRVYEEKILRFGSFERRTKIRPIDDIDLMLCMSGEGKRTYTEAGNVIYINGCESDSNSDLLTNGTGCLNSTKVINRFISKLSGLKDYKKAEMHKNHEAATLQLKSYTWNSEPRIDNERTTGINQKHNRKLLELIRLVKYWNNRKVTLKSGSYLLE